MKNIEEYIGVVLIALFVGGAPTVAQEVGDPCWCESNDGGGDAGALPNEAQSTLGGKRPVLNCLDGELAGMSPGPPDLEDMYLIKICDLDAFLARTVIPDPPPPFNTMLWLFSADDSLGRVANDNISKMIVRSRITAFPTDGEPPLAATGLYYIAVSGFRRIPRAGGLPIFLIADPLEISGPDGAGGALPIDEWVTPGPPSAIGNYRISFVGVAYSDSSTEDCNDNGVDDSCDIVNGDSKDTNQNGIPDECEPCDGDIDGSLVVDFSDLLAVLAAWGPYEPCPPFVPEDIDENCDVGFSDLLVVLGAWGPCE